VLYDDLTVEEHLNLVCSIKDVKEHRVVRDIDDTLELVMLQQHREKKVKELSGGMKRKLSLGMALLGQPQTIILDEPTSGLDVESRRQVWDLILKIRQNRSIILCTQHIEEADYLSNRVCILSHGRLIALDTPDNIKKHFGVGYNLIIEHRDAGKAGSSL
jgi:ABC-type multidrug transport system ATPase subunit